MLRWMVCILSFVLLGGQTAAHAQTALDTSGTLVVIPAMGEVRQENDEAFVTLSIEEQDKDKAAAVSRVNRKMKQGTEIIRREDPGALLSTRGYYTYPVYPDEPLQPRQGKTRQPIAWRVGQLLEMHTANLVRLPKTVAAAQTILALNGIRFGLSAAAGQKLQEQLIAIAYANLNDRILAVAKAMGRRLSDASLETVDFEGSGAYAQKQEVQSPRMMAATAAAPMEEPSFEPGETTLSIRVVGKIRFK